MDYETGKKFEEIDQKLTYFFNILDKAGMIPKEDKEDKKNV